MVSYLRQQTYFGAMNPTFASTTGFLRDTCLTDYFLKSKTLYYVVL